MDLTDNCRNTVSLSFPLNRSSSTGVVPRREWGEAKTVMTESAATLPGEVKASDVSTDNHFSPWAKTNLEHPEVLPEPAVTPTTRPRLQSSRLELPTTSADPEEILNSQGAPKKKAESQSTLPPVVAPLPGEQTDVALGPGTATPSRVPLYIALLLAIIALLGGLIWLVSQR